MPDHRELAQMTLVELLSAAKFSDASGVTSELLRQEITRRAATPTSHHAALA
ncbi:hypothetical protein FHT02_004306 [Sphingomonas xinjiangensis]|uniref:Uncharacterized protein n=1 Tax=Sphingomonas xinjiangensis TaxID=643568 RepID=A0A840YTN0_9SPHN|nr:hypothetical protein [Sphingomonas xinjiangensis]